jgi:GNAT superfamily N-acetyltransferase
MFRDMGSIAPGIEEAFQREAEIHFREAIPTGTYVAWVASPAGRPAEIIAGGGVQLRPMLPRPGDTGDEIIRGPEGIVLNMYTERSWRRRGIAALLMRRILEWAEYERISRLVLHASNEGRPLYEKLGFVQTNEMKLRREARDDATAESRR